MCVEFAGSGRPTAIPYMTLGSCTHRPPSRRSPNLRTLKRFRKRGNRYNWVYSEAAIRRRIWGFGVGLVSIALSALGVVYPARFAPYGRFFIGCLCFGIGLCVLTTLLWLLERLRPGPEKRHEYAPVPSATAKSEVGHIEQRDIGAR